MRRKSFLKGITNDTHPAVRNKALQAAFFCDVCLETFAELSRNVHLIPEYAKSHLLEQKSRKDQLLNSLREAYQLASQVKTDELRESNLLLADALAKSAQNTIQSGYTFGILELEMLQTSVSFCMETLPELFARDDDRFILGAALKLMLMIIGIVPGGALGSAAIDIKDIVQAREQEAKQAGDYFSRIDRFIESISYWCVGTQMLVTLIQNLDNLADAEAKLSYSASSEIVTARFKKILANPQIRGHHINFPKNLSL
jgi:hypothetical protein